MIEISTLLEAYFQRVAGGVIAAMCVEANGLMRAA